MKYKYNGNWVDLSIKALDSMPVGTEVDFDGTSANIPTGWEEVSNVLYENVNGTTGNITLNDNINNYSYIEIITMNKDSNDESLGVYKFQTDKTKYVISSLRVTTNSFNAFMKIYTKTTNTQLTADTGKLYTGSTSSVSNYEVFSITKVIGYK